MNCFFPENRKRIVWQPAVSENRPRNWQIVEKVGPILTLFCTHIVIYTKILSNCWIDSIAASLFVWNWLSWQIVSDDKIQITTLILRRGALSMTGRYCHLRGMKEIGKGCQRKWRFWLHSIAFLSKHFKMIQFFYIFVIGCRVCPWFRALCLEVSRWLVKPLWDANWNGKSRSQSKI